MMKAKLGRGLKTDVEFEIWSNANQRPERCLATPHLAQIFDVIKIRENQTNLRIERNKLFGVY